MPTSRRKYLIGLLLLLVSGVAIGWLYDQPLAGLAVAALLIIAQQLRQLLTFERALMEDRFDDVPLGDGIWSQMLARVSFIRQRGRKHKRRHRRLLREVRNSTNAMPDGGVVLNRDMEIVLSNQAAQDLVGIRIPQDRRQRIDNILRDPRFVKFLKSADHDATVDIPSPQENDRWISCRLVPFGENQQLLLLRDVTDAFRLNTMRRDFVANASHELRTPLTVISGYLDTLTDADDIPPDWEQPLSQMRGQADRMNRVVAELLELSRLENPQSDRDEQAVDIQALLTRACQAMEGVPDTPELCVETTLDARLRGMPAELESIVSNLLANAVRHTPADGRVTLSWRCDQDGNGILSVADTGEGIDAEFLPRLTERFFRVDSGRSRDAGGIGLGLAIVKHALMLHDGRLDISSEPGKGSRFACLFPASRLVAADPAPAASAGQGR